MTNPRLAEDYLLRARGRRKAIKGLFKEGLFADVIRECQEACELALKSVIRKAGHSVPFTHDVSDKLQAIKSDLPRRIQKQLGLLCRISKSLRRDRELSFYGSEDITPSEFYGKQDAIKALKELDQVLAVIGTKD